jgi:hypothetical protein
MKSYSTNDAAMLMKADTSIYIYMYHSAASKHWVTTIFGAIDVGGGDRWMIHTTVCIYVLIISFHGTGECDASVRSFQPSNNNNIAMPKMSSSTGALLVRRGIRKSYRYSLLHLFPLPPDLMDRPFFRQPNKRSTAKPSCSLSSWAYTYTYLHQNVHLYFDLGSKRRGLHTQQHNKYQKFQWRIITDPQHHHRIIHLHHLHHTHPPPPPPLPRHRYRYQEVPWHIRIIVKYLSEDYRGKLPKNRYDGTLNNTDL